MEEVIDRRAAISAAFDAEEAKGSSEGEPVESAPAAAPSASNSQLEKGPSGAEREEAGTTPAAEPGDAPTGLESKAEKPAITAAPRPDGIDKAPQSWRPAQREKWAALDPEVRQEVMKRERETTRALDESSSARRLAQQFNEAVAPFQARLTSLNASPLAAFQELLKTDYILATGPAHSKAAMMAKLIKDYGVDIGQLDAALSGAGVPQPQNQQNDIDARVQQLLAQQLAPFQNFMRSQEQERTQQTSQSVDQMAADEVKFPYFADVREDMADVIEISAKKGLYLSLEQAYTRAIGMNPEVSALVSAKQTAEATRAAAQTLNGRAQRALNASSSIGGTPGGAPTQGANPNDRRATIAAAFEAASGR